MPEIDLFEAMYSQLSVTRYKRDPVPQEAIDKIIEAATMAPSGGNTQPWEFIAITDPDIISQVGNVYRELVAAGPGRSTAAQRTAGLPVGPVPGQPHARSTGDDSGLRRPRERLGPGRSLR